MEGLPQDIIVDIFSKMPAKSLCRFKCLSKAFMALITSPWFVELHKNQNQQRQTVMVDDLIVRNSLLCLDIDRGITTVDQLHFPIENCCNDCAWILGSCNGLLWLLIYDDTARSSHVIYNYTTREFKRIPPYKPFDERYTSLYALGYAQSIDDFKVFGVSDPYDEVEVTSVHVFSLRNNTWKTFEINNFVEFRADLWAIHLNGTIHFGFCKLNFDDPFMIAAFDLVEDKFKFLALPHLFGYDAIYSYSVRSIGDCLCLIPVTTKWEKEFWIMKEYGVKESWTRISLANSILHLQPLCPFKDSDSFLSVLGEKFVLFNPNDGSYEDFVIDGLQEDLEDCNLVVYAEAADSLISPNSRANFQSEGALDLELKTGTVEDSLSYQYS
ncbi:F-box/kelch-repeat protein At3g06240-like [Citrus clementina]|uniref:F-box/kelch-repeat protein At3g06240-like n=1 Tax=Citrus clementina TaxID=85681 RepID=UPI000CED6F4F|nr:F-box/kelch-repeat protein At3g06240-like [Citrus x clementina]